MFKFAFKNAWVNGQFEVMHKQLGGILFESCLAMLLLSILLLPIASHALQQLLAMEDNHIRSIAIVQSRAYLLMQHHSLLRHSVSGLSYAYYWKKDQRHLIEGVVLSKNKLSGYSICMHWHSDKNWCWN